MTQDTTWTNTITAITLFVENLAEAKTSYSRVFELPVFCEGDTSVVFKFGATMINLLQIGQADELVTPAHVASGQSGARAVYTLTVDDVDARCAQLETKGVTLLNGPMDRPWGIRTSSFKDPAGNIWEIAR
jgi:lactoylglutathione lyase